MAATYKPTDASAYAKLLVKNMPLGDVEVRILEAISSMIWMAAPWRWTLGSMPAVTLTANTQDYTVAIPSDFLWLVDPYVASGSNTPQPLSAEPVLPTDVKVVGQPTKIAVIGTPGGSGTYRVMPKLGSVASPAPQIISLYKKAPPSITAATKGTAGQLVMGDEWFHVYEAGVLWLAYMYADDQRAGSAQVDPATGKVMFSGQRAVFEAGILRMKEVEPLQLTEPKSAQEGRGERK